MKAKVVARLGRTSAAGRSHAGGIRRGDADRASAIRGATVRRGAATPVTVRLDRVSSVTKTGLSTGWKVAIYSGIAFAGVMAWLGATIND